MTDFKKFIGTSKKPGVGIDRTFNLGYFYATSCALKSLQVVSAL
jgi:hypothetical protein